MNDSKIKRMFAVVRRTLLVIFTLFLSQAFVSCQLENVGQTAEVMHLPVSLPDFKKLVIHDDINVVLYQADSLSAILEGPQDVIQNFESQLIDGTLILKQSNNLQWLNGFPQLTVHMYAPELRSIEFRGYGNLSSADTLHIERLSINADNAYGTIDLTVKSEKLGIVSNCAVEIDLKGKTKYLNIGSYYNDGLVLANELEAEQVLVDHKGESVIKVKALHSLKGEIWNTGDLLYFGNPEEVQVKISGQGRLIHKQE